MTRFISLREAAKISGYHPDYLGFLIRAKRISGEKIGRNWCITEEALNDYLREAKEAHSAKRFFWQKKLLVFSVAFLMLFLTAAFLSVFVLPGAFQRQAVSSAPAAMAPQTKTASGVQVTSYVLDDSGEIGISTRPAGKTQR